MKLFILLVCVGVAVANNRPYIIGGNDVTTAGKWPHQGSMRHYGSHACGISLISSIWGVTAAHCMDDRSIDSLSFQFGSNNRKQGGQVVKAVKITVHENFDTGAGWFPNDIAVVQFAEAVNTANTAPIPLADGTIDHAGNSDCWITGWGKTDTISEMPDILQEAKINVYTDSKCREDWGSSINNGHVCIGDKANRKSVCEGDSGGPLVCKVNGRYELVGATSWGVLACNPNVPSSVYSRVGYFRQWIKDNSGV